MVEDELEAALRGIIGTIERSEGRNVIDCLTTIDGLLRSRKDELDVQLVHYLSRRSYEKALRHLKDSSTSRENS